MNKVIIGIDPDTNKSGFALKYPDGRLYVDTLYFFSLLQQISWASTEYKDKLLVRVSAGWLNKKTNFHNHIKRKGQWIETPGPMRDAISVKVGRNHQVGLLICEYCRRENITYEEVMPVSAKWSPTMFEKVTGIKTKCQEIIDAAVLVL